MLELRYIYIDSVNNVEHNYSGFIHFTFSVTKRRHLKLDYCNGVDRRVVQSGCVHLEVDPEVECY